MKYPANQNPEQLAHDTINRQLIACGWIIRDKHAINLHTGTGIAIREYLIGERPTDYILFMNEKPAGVIEAKWKEEGMHLTARKTQTKTLPSPQRQG